MSLEHSSLLAVYLHWPFCLRRCSYCDFNVKVCEHVHEEEWLPAFHREMALMRVLTGDRYVSSIFIGGGTPSLMSVSSIESLIKAIAYHWSLIADSEITIEANPIDLDKSKLQGLCQAGVNRISIGVQALDDEALQFLGRDHDSAMAISALQQATDIFPHVNCDLISGRPGQSSYGWERELTRVGDYLGAHISVYQLTIEPGTSLARQARQGALSLPSESQRIALDAITERRLAEYGFHRYEVSNYARDQATCRHHLTCWYGGDYVGIGPGAVSRLTQNGSRWASRRPLAPHVWREITMREDVDFRDENSLDSQAGQGWFASWHQLTAEEYFVEIVLTGLRTAKGLSESRLIDCFGCRARTALASPVLAELCTEGLLQRYEGHLAATHSGFAVLDAVITEWLAAE